MLPKTTHKQRRKRKHRLKHQYISGLPKLKSTLDLTSVSHRGLVVGMTKVYTEQGQWR